MKLSKYIIFFIAQLFSVVVCFPQSEKIDSLLKVLPSLKDSARIDCLNALSYEYILSGKKEPAEYYAESAYEDSKKLNYIHGIAISVNTAAMFCLCCE